MIETIKDKIILFRKKLELCKINYLNHKFKKYIVKYEEDKDNLKIYNSCGDCKIVKNTIPIDEKIDLYENNKEDYKFIILSSGITLFALGCTYIFSFFVGSYILFVVALLAFITMLSLFTINLFNTFINREEVKRLINIKENKIVLDDKELRTIAKDSFVYIKKYFYNIILKIMNLIDNIKVKFN